MNLGATLYIKNTIEAVEFYKEAFGMTLGYNEKFPDGTPIYMQNYKRMGKPYLQSVNTKMMS